MTPKTWENVKFSDIASFKYGKMPTKNKILETGGYPIYSGYRYVGYYNEYNIDKNTLIIIARGVGGTGDVKLTKEKCYLTNLSIAVFPFNNNSVNTLYLYYYFLLHNLRYLDSGSAQSQITISDLEKLVIKLPPLETQKKIAVVLSSLDDKIELNNKINQNLEQQAQAIFKSWFVDFEPFGGKMPEDWSLKILSDISNITAGGDKPDIVSNIETEECKIPIYSNGIDNNGLYGYTTEPKILQESVTVSARGTIGFTCLRLHPYVPIVRLISLIPRTDIVSAKYLYFSLLNKHITGTGTTQQQLTVPYFKTTPIIVPTFDIVNQFTEIVNSFYKIIEKNICENKRLIQLRDTLLPKLMSGEIDVDNVEV